MFLCCFHHNCYGGIMYVVCLNNCVQEVSQIRICCDLRLVAEKCVTIVDFVHKRETNLNVYDVYSAFYKDMFRVA